MLLAKPPDFNTPQLRVIAAAAFGNVMEQGRHVQDPGLVPAGGQLRAKRVLVGVLHNKKPAHIAQHHQDVLVHRVNMEQVMLHLPHNFAKHPQVPAQHRGLVHQPHGMGQAVSLHQYLTKSVAVDRVVAELAVHQTARVVQGPQRASGQALHPDSGLVDQKSFQNRVGLALIQVVAGHLHHAGFLHEPFVDGARLVG